MKEIMTIKEISSYLNISISTIRNMVRSKRIPHFRIGNRIYFKANSIDEWLKNLEEKEKPIGFIY